MDEKPSVINIALVGGGGLCREILEKTTFDYQQEEVSTPILAVADPDPETPGMVIARERGLLTFFDYHELYDARYSIHLIILMTPDEAILKDVLETRPFHIRILSYPVFEVFWNAIGAQEKQLRQRNQEMETIINGIQDFISVITPDREIAEVNEAFLKQMGCSRKDVIGQYCHAVFQRQNSICNPQDIVCPLNEVIRNKRPTRQIMTRIGSKGESNYFEVNIYPIWEKDGRISKFIEISRDITKRFKEEEEITRRLEQMVEQRTEQLNDTHAKLLHKDKMASLGKLSASVVHEINNPLSGVLNLIILIKRIMKESGNRDKNTEEIRRYLDLMETETKRTSRIVSNLLAFSRQSKMELNRLDLNRLIEKTLFLNANLLKINQVKVERHLFPDIPDIVGSEDQLQQVFMNIVSNAAESMEATGGGVLRIETGYQLGDDRIFIKLSDTGVGIPQTHLTELFEPFFTTKKKGKGVGLGLSVAYGIIKEHDGSIHVKSKEGNGAMFIVELPLKPSVKAMDRHGDGNATNKNSHS
ncbi:nitrogen regulation protein NR(II) [Thermodesulfobacteriota bacterium]